MLGTTDKPAFAKFLALMFRNTAFLWDMNKHDMASNNPAYINPEGDYLFVRRDMLTPNDVVIIDSWTKLSQDCGLQYAVDNMIDPFSGDVGKKAQSGKEDSMDFYRYMDRVLDTILHGINTMNSHVIIIGHQQFYEHEVKEGIVKVKKNRLQVVSSTGKHGAKLPGAVSDVLWFEPKQDSDPTKLTTTIHGEAGEWRDGGGRTIPPLAYDFKNFKWIDFCNTGQIPLPSVVPSFEENNPFQYYKGEDLIRELTPAAEQQAGVITSNT